MRKFMPFMPLSVMLLLLGYVGVALATTILNDVSVRNLTVRGNTTMSGTCAHCNVTPTPTPTPKPTNTPTATPTP